MPPPEQPSGKQIRAADHNREEQPRKAEVRERRTVEPFSRHPKRRAARNAHKRLACTDSCDAKYRMQSDQDPAGYCHPNLQSVMRGSALSAAPRAAIVATPSNPATVLHGETRRPPTRPQRE